MHPNAIPPPLPWTGVNARNNSIFVNHHAESNAGMTPMNMHDVP
jgi:hypothetical protein